MARQSHRALRVLLGLFSLIAAVAGVFLIFISRGMVMSMFFHPPESEISDLLLATVKELGGLEVTLGVMLYFAWRDPVRNVSIIHAFIAGLCVLTVTPLISLYTTDLGRLYPGYLIWGRSLIRLGLAVVLYLLRPREAAEGRP